MIEVKVKSSAEWKQLNRCHLGISLHNPNLAGEPLAAIVDWINAQHFDECFIDLSDTLHRHNIMNRTGLDEQAAGDRARHEGDMWLEENSGILDRLNLPFRLYRWDHWRESEDVAAGIAAFTQAYETGGDFRDAVVRDIETLSVRSGQELDDARLSCGVRYLLEELAVLSFYFRDYPCAKIYPGREQSSFRIVRKGEVAGVPAGLQNVFYTQLWLHRPVLAAETLVNGKKAA